jgi:hypothetical protein
MMKSVITSLAVCIPCFCLTVYLMETNVNWVASGLIVLIILGLMACNFLFIIVLEQHRSKLGTLTFPALLAAVGLVLAFMITGAIDRFFKDFGYSWLFPAVVLTLFLSYAAIFKEKTVAMKFHLGLNGIALTVLWFMGAADKIALPF